MEENKYNILITYRGDGDFKFVVKKIGEVSISKGKPVYIYNVDAGVINDLRTMKRLLLDVSIGSKPDGAYKIYNFDNYTSMPKAVPGQRPNLVNAEPISNNEISQILRGGSTPEPEVVPEVKPVKEEPKEEPKEESKPKATKKTTTKKKTTKKK